MSEVVMVLRGQANGQPTPFDGQFLKSFDHEAFDGAGDADFTPGWEEALRFPNLAAALEFRNRSPNCKPRRADGLPNRPLTATHWEVVRVEQIINGSFKG